MIFNIYALNNIKLPVYGPVLPSFKIFKTVLNNEVNSV